MYTTIYESSPRRSPRHIHPPSESNILKPKSNSPIRKSKASQQSLKKILNSSNALATVTRDATQNAGEKPRNASNAVVREARRKRIINDENKENCGTVSRRSRMATVGVNGSELQGKKTVPLQSKLNSRMPLKELPLNGFVERLKKREVVTSVEIVVIPFFERG
jgi:hypothetical protein